MGQLVEDQAADGVVGVAGQGVFQTEPVEKVVERALPVDQTAAVLAPDDVRLFARVGQFADQGFENVAQGDDAARHAEFVADDAVAQLLRAQLFEGVVDLEPFVEEFRRSDQPAQVESLVAQVQEEVFEADHAQQFVETSLADGVAVVGRSGHRLADLRCGRRRVDPCQFAAVGHDRLHGAVAQREDAAHDLLFDRLHLAVLGAFLDDRTDFRLGDLALGPLQAQQAGDARRASGEQPHEGRRRDRKQPHRLRNDFCGPLGGVHADAFGNQFAEDDREVGDRDDDRDLRRDGRRAQRNAQPGQLSAEFRRQRVAGVNTRENADQGDADLYGREEPVGVFGQFQGLAGACAALPGLHLQIRAAGRYERDLRHGEQPVEQDQQQNDENFHGMSCRFVSQR